MHTRNMFIPLGGIFVFGGCDSRECRVNRIVMGCINLLMGALAVFFGFYYDVIFLTVIGFIVASLGLMMVIANLFGLRAHTREHSHNVKS